MNTMKEGEHEPDQDEGDNGNDDEDEHRDEVDSWQRRRNLGA